METKILSKHGLNCKGPCYHANTDIIHPLYFEKVTMNKPFCPVNEWTFIDNITKKSTRQIVDECDNPTEKTQEKNTANILLPDVGFDPIFFLTYVYDLTNFEDSINWIISHDEILLKTRMRVLIMALKGFGKNIEILDYRVANIIEELLLHNIELLYNNFFNYVSVSGKMVSKNNDSHDDGYDIKKKYIIDFFITKERIYKFLIKFMNSNKENMDKIDQNIIINDFIEYIKNKIIKTIKNKK